MCSLTIIFVTTTFYLIWNQTCWLHPLLIYRKTGQPLGNSELCIPWAFSLTQRLTFNSQLKSPILLPDIFLRLSFCPVVHIMHKSRMSDCTLWEAGLHLACSSALWISSTCLSSFHFLTNKALFTTILQQEAQNFLWKAPYHSFTASWNAMKWHGVLQNHSWEMKILSLHLQSRKIFSCQVNTAFW